ncbi:hypothetical protein SAMN06265365_11563 [Tistlia consotensis]|uniref:BMFP domain-containing protein YqiC n=2 Tax=Tistlia TaxID=1321364 RepID=A0A1Y6CAX3_9PROT|nr:accessory factor UbiK family protein [Tistlia consotensis]SMF46154.1 hypothetical protein SAMN05428998_11671 [Tistlia consotensis USBA 355]SNR78838.1 hypothetical protein SAMN06265365_11563 [Tistlia consotensis]
MQTQNPFFDDIAKMMSGAMGVASGMRDEMEARFREWFEGAASRMDLVGREEFEAVKAMAAKARQENEALARRVAELEAALAGRAAAGAKASAAKASRPRKAAKPKAAPKGGAAADAPSGD